MDRRLDEIVCRFTMFILVEDRRGTDIFNQCFSTDDTHVKIVLKFTTNSQKSSLLSLLYQSKN